VLILDEPVSHFDIRYQIKTLEILDGLGKEGMTIVMVLHDLNLASEFCKKIVLISEGTVFKVGTSQEVLTYKNIEHVYKTVVVVKENPEIIEKIQFLQNAIGAIPSPFDCFLTLRGLKTLSLRMEKHSHNAMMIARFLESHPKVKKVSYPGLLSHPQHEIAKKQMKLFGGMISFELKGGIEESRRFLESCKLFSLAESLGGVESLIEHPAIMTHASIPKEIRESLGITDGFIRLSVGIEDHEDLISDLENALTKI
jgi:cystathionine beta-lyase/cystathionine gamma-synthase